MWKKVVSKLQQKPKSNSHSDSVTGDVYSNASSLQRTGSNDGNNHKRNSSVVFPSSLIAGIEPLLFLKDATGQEKSNLIINKLNICCVIFDFTDENKNSAEKDMKKQALRELINYIGMDPPKFSEQMISTICRMFACNLFRIFPPRYKSKSSATGEMEEEEVKFDPAWPHLQLVYELLLKFVGSSSLDPKIAKKYFDHLFVLRLLELFDSEDPRERNFLKAILHRTYAKFMVHRPLIRKTVSNMIYQFVYETDKHNGIRELLEVFGSVISGFALPLKEEHKIFLRRVLIPLHKPKSVGVYIQHLTYCVTQFIEKEPNLASTVIMGLLKYWPVTNSQKEVMFLSELEEILEMTNIVGFERCMVPLFRRIGCCLSSSHFQVAERALFFWNKDHIIGMIEQNRHAIMPIIVPAIEKNVMNHWNQAVRNQTVNVAKILVEMDDKLFSECQRKHKEGEGIKMSIDEKRKITWERLEAAASHQPVTENTPVLVNRID